MTGKFVSPEDLEELKKQWEQALGTPVMTFQCGGPDLASMARSLVLERVNKLALKYGCKKRKEGYGINLETGEFLPTK